MNGKSQIGIHLLSHPDNSQALKKKNDRNREGNGGEEESIVRPLLTTR